MVERGEGDGSPSPLVRTMMEKLWPYTVTATQDEKRSIHRVPLIIRERDPASYEPLILSVGPYHHGNPKLKAMEDHKWRYLHSLLRRKHPSHSIESLLARCIEVVRGSEARARSYYSEPVDLGTDDFVKMMVLDGCFIVELLLIFMEDEEEDDPILNAGWMCNVIRRDILKLENQIPFFIVEELFDVAMGTGATDPSLRQHVFYYLMLRRADETPLPEQHIYHLLHFYDVILLPKGPESPNTSTNTLSWSSGRLQSVLEKMRRCTSSSRVQSVLMKMRRFTSRSFTLPTWCKPKPTDHKMSQITIPCAVELGEVGIKLRRKPTETFLDVTFHDGTLSIPFLSIEDGTIPVFRNLVALEQCRPDLGSHFTWYVTFLDCIVNTPKDVSILQNRGIVQNLIGSEEEVAQLINQLGKEMTINRMNHKFAKLFREVNKHCQSSWHKHRARFMLDHFSSPWSIISLVAAVFLLLMTAAQVVLAILSYNKQ